MTTTRGRRLILVGAGALAVVLALTVGRTAAFHFFPPEWTGEAARLADVLQIRPAATVADIGAGDGEMAIAIARVVGGRGVLYATELAEEQRAEIAKDAREAGLPQVRIIAAAERATGLPDACCDAIYLRNVLHHIAARDVFAKDLHRAVKPGGRVAVIDFGPGAFFHLAGSHGIAPQQVAATLAAAGFRVERRIEEWGGGLYAVIATRD